MQWKIDQNVNIKYANYNTKFVYYTTHHHCHVNTWCTNKIFRFFFFCFRKIMHSEHWKRLLKLDIFRIFEVNNRVMLSICFVALKFHFTYFCFYFIRINWQIGQENLFCCCCCIYTNIYGEMFETLQFIFLLWTVCYQCAVLNRGGGDLFSVVITWW